MTEAKINTLPPVNDHRMRWAREMVLNELAILKHTMLSPDMIDLVKYVIENNTPVLKPTDVDLIGELYKHCFNG